MLFLNNHNTFLKFGSTVFQFYIISPIVLNIGEMKFSSWKAELDHCDFLPFMTSVLPDNYEEHDKEDRIKA